MLLQHPRSVFLCCLAACLAVVGCRRKDGAGSHAINMRGSDTLVQVATAWAEHYSEMGKGVSVNASGGGSGTGIAALIDGTVDIATSSREIKDQERADIRSKRGMEVHEHVVGYDALAIYVNPDNPIDEISLPEMQEIWAEDGALSDWSLITPFLKGKLILIGRQNSSGTYDYFREVVCGKTKQGVAREFRGGVSELNGSSEVIEKISKVKQSLGYTGMGYKNDHVKWLRVARKKGEPGVLPSIDSARSGAYPIARKLYLYTVGEVSSHVRDFLEWTMSQEGQAIVGQEGYVPVK